MSSLEPASVSPLPDGITDPNYKPLPGRLGNLTPGQQHALDTLKRQLVEGGHFVPERMDDATLLRFLRARKFDVAKTKAMVLSAEQWRKDFDVEDIVKNFVFTEKKEVDKYYPQYYHKMDKDGRPVYIQRLGKIDVNKLNDISSPDRQLRRFVLEYEKFLTERLPACAHAVGHPVETSCTIMDLAGVSIASFYRVKDYVFQAAGIGQDRYPECMGKFYIINAPWAFSTVWSIIKPWLDEVTVAKIDIVSSAMVKEKLLSQIPAENLPVEFGGKCQCVGGCSLSDVGPWNPQTELNGEA
ncbi:CRAL-TRIO domain-containing protein [Boletus edulis BED1]|uniref:CRAL-TRIO domain-containing protein n=1 Tax=Boletus edulis BED1 TaxID=1328754 RepID=A0AAD4GLM1_BOLED|nr:CRAL-TRIO domain-containing protein [Boletus edulis BED1]